MATYWIIRVLNWLLIAIGGLSFLALTWALGVGVLDLDQTAVMVLVLVLGINLAFAGLIAGRARDKGRSWGAFFVLTVLISPIITWLIVEAIQPSYSQVIDSDEIAPDSKKCPYCAEEVKAEAIKCKHCGSQI